MKKVLLGAGMGVFLATVPCFAQTPPAAVPAEVATTRHHHERHPELHKAMKELRDAKDHLEKAAHDFGGHRVKAIEAINHAIEEVHDAMEFDKH
jgi:hypothetical protein